MTKYINKIGIAIFFILVLFSFGFSEETFTITTYYPSPYGSYNQLRVSGSGGDLELGDATATGNLPITIWLTNNSGASRSAGTIVIIGSSNNSFTVIATANSTAVLGVVYDSTIANGSAGRIAIGGVVSVLSAAATTRGQHVATSTTSGRASSTATPTAGASIGVWLETLAGAGTGRALLR